MMFQKTNKNIQALDLKIDNLRIKRVYEFNFLGLILDSQLNWSKHIVRVSNLCSMKIGVLNKLKYVLPLHIRYILYNSFVLPYLQCRINNGANGAAAPGPPQLGAPHKGFFFCTLILPGTLFEANFIYIIAKMRSLPDPAGGLTAPPRHPAVLHAASGSVGLGHRGSHSPREKPPTKVLHQAPHIGNPALPI